MKSMMEGISQGKMAVLLIVTVMLGDDTKAFAATCEFGLTATGNSMFLETGMGRKIETFSGLMVGHKIDVVSLEKEQWLLVFCSVLHSHVRVVSLDVKSGISAEIFSFSETKGIIPNLRMNPDGQSLLLDGVDAGPLFITDPNDKLRTCEIWYPGFDG